MAGSGREARRRRIIEGGQDRLALITGRKPNYDPGSSPPFDHSSVSEIEEDISTFSSNDHLAARLSQGDALDGRSKERPFVRQPGPINVPMRAFPSEARPELEPPSIAQNPIFAASDAVLWVAQQIPISNVTSQQVSVAVAVTEHDRFLCAVTLAILVVLSYTGFPIIGSRVFRWLILFRPLFVVLITNITLIVGRLLPDNRKNLVRGDKDNNTNMSFLGDGYAWAEEAGRALELGLMLQNVGGALFMDCSVYATIVVFGLSLFG